MAKSVVLPPAPPEVPAGPVSQAAPSSGGLRARAARLWPEWRPAVLTGAVAATLFWVFANLVSLVARYGPTFPQELSRQRFGILKAAWGAWDWGWYDAIVTQGYGAASHRLIAPGVYQDGTAFAPGFPTVVKAASAVLHLNDLYVAIGLNFVLLGVLLTGLYKLAEMDGGRKVAALAVFFLLVWPGAGFLVAAYPETMLITCLVWAFLLLRRGQLIVPGLLLGVATAVKIPAAAFALPMAWEWLDARGGWRPAWRWLRFSAVIVPPILAAGAWMLYLDRRFGDPLRFLEAQKGWFHHFEPLWVPLRTELGQLFSLEMFHGPMSADGLIRLLDTFSILFLIAMAVYVFLRVRRSYGVYLGVGVILFGFAGTFGSTTRYMIEMFPIFIVLAMWAVRRSWLERLITVASLPLLIMFIARFTTGQWAG